MSANLAPIRCLVPCGCLVSIMWVHEGHVAPNLIIYCETATLSLFGHLEVVAKLPPND